MGWVVGGSGQVSDHTMVTSFDPSDGSFANSDLTALSFKAARASAQWNMFLYVHEVDSDTVHRFNLDLGTEDVGYSQTVATALRNPCYAIAGDFLYISGGLDLSDNGLNAVYVLNLLDQLWTGTAPGMSNSRGSHGCAVSAGKLYVIGGSYLPGDSPRRDSVCPRLWNR